MAVPIITLSTRMAGTFLPVFNIMMDVGLINRETSFHILKGLAFKGFFHKPTKLLQLNKFAFDHFVWNSMNARYVKLLVLVSAPLSTHIIWIKFLPIKIVLTIAQFDAKQICTVMLSSGSQSHFNDTAFGT